VSDPCVNCGGDGFVYDDRGVPSICWSCGGTGISRYRHSSCPVKPLCDHPGPRCTDCPASGCIRRCRPYQPCGNRKVVFPPSPKVFRSVRPDESAEADEFPVVVYDTGKEEKKR
jgi:hypothetical protein